jgi:hypothetical protein
MSRIAPESRRSSERKAGRVHLGRWLVKHAPKVEFEAPERKAGDRNPFSG